MIVAAAKSAGLPVLTPSANFIFVKVADANAVQQAMASKGRDDPRHLWQMDASGRGYRPAGSRTSRAIARRCPR